jgi:carboxypeptidase PM20D1
MLSVRRALLTLAVVLAVLVGLVAINTLRLDPHLPTVAPYRPTLDEEAAVARLAESLRIPTLSATEDIASLAPFHALHARLATWFPRVHESLQPEVVNGGGLLYRLAGRDHCPALLLAAHADVVPVEPGTEGDWRYPPFSGALAEGAVWGRGAIDDKASLMAILESVEALLEAGYAPRCTLLLAFGHDEETGGRLGAAAIAARLMERGVEVGAVLDEGGAITRGLVPGSDLPLASIGVAEKGYLSLRLVATASGGHSSMPPARTAIGRLASALAKLETERPSPRLSPILREMLGRIAPHAAPGLRVALANLWLFEPLVLAQLAKSPTTDATLRTTTAPTLLDAGIKDNVLPQRAEGVVNFRIQPGDSVASVTTRVSDLVAEFDVQVTPVDGFGSEPTAPADWNDPLFRRIEVSIRAASEESALLVAPYVTSGATDARHYAILTPRLLRFAPMQLDAELLASFHGTNERIPLAEYRRMLRFYRHLLEGWGREGWADVGPLERPGGA